MKLAHVDIAIFATGHELDEDRVSCYRDTMEIYARHGRCRVAHCEVLECGDDEDVDVDEERE